jgi:hypothetical protein
MRGRRAYAAPMTTTPKPLRQIILEQVAACGPGKSVDPNDIARAAAAQKPKAPKDAWRNYLKPVRAEALGLARAGEISILRKGKPVDPGEPIKGVIRLSLPPTADSEA